jgi:hypothetical protein
VAPLHVRIKRFEQERSHENGHGQGTQQACLQAATPLSVSRYGYSSIGEAMKAKVLTCRQMAPQTTGL